jgi:hypothetical protein
MSHLDPTGLEIVPDGGDVYIDTLTGEEVYFTDEKKKEADAVNEQWKQNHPEYEWSYDIESEMVRKLNQLEGQLKSIRDNVKNGQLKEAYEEALSFLTGENTTVEAIKKVLEPLAGDAVYVASIVKACTTIQVLINSLQVVQAASKGVIPEGSTVTPRVTRGQEPGIHVTRPDGSVIDITPSRVKEFTPVTDPRAPAGLLNQVKFPSDVPTLPGSKGYKRYPTAEELKVLYEATK